MLGAKAIELLIPSEGMRIDPSACVYRRFSRSQCRSCAEVCPTAAMTVEKGPAIDRTRCGSCRRCEAVCPTGAILGDTRELGELAAILAESSGPILGCREPGVTAHAHTGCLGFLGVEGLLALSIFFPEGVSFNLTRCSECPNAQIASGLATDVTAVVGLDAGGGTLSLVNRAEDLTFRENGFSRREFFDVLRRRSVGSFTQAAKRLGQVQPVFDGRRKNLPAQRRLLLRALPLLSDETRQRIERELFPRYQFTSSCSSCTGCAGICPTGAITVGGEDRPEPVFLRQFCTNCKLCTAFCRKSGISDA